MVVKKIFLILINFAVGSKEGEKEERLGW